MILNGIELDGLAEHSANLVLPPVVQGRVVHIDADFLAYQTTAQKADGSDTKTFEDMKHNAATAIETLKGLAGATAIHLHVTPSSSDKGGRYEHAVLKEYQGNRQDKEKPQYLNIMRQWLVDNYNGTSHQFCEADDGMAANQYRAIAAKAGHLSIIASKDKDLSMVPGLHLDWDTGEVIETSSEFGEIWIDESKSQKRLKGFGQKFFWAQMLMGDTADNISGLPFVHRTVMEKLKPSKEAQKHLKVLELHPAQISQEARAAAETWLKNRPHTKCGPVLSYELLSKCKTNKEAYLGVKTLYSLLTDYQHWKTQLPVSWQQAFVSEAKLLWMRRSERDSDDVLKWMKETCV